MTTTHLLRLEGASFFLLAGYLLLVVLGLPLWWLALLLVGPDFSMCGYLMGPRVGAFTYNLFHTYTTGGLLIVLGLALAHPIVMALGIVVVGHGGMDRALGYGLKRETAFFDTHLG